MTGLQKKLSVSGTIRKIGYFLFSFLLLIFFFSTPIYAAVKMSGIFSDNMVLQQKSTVKLWGTANKNSAVTIFTSWNSKQYKVAASADGNWKVNITTPAAGGPYQIRISDGKQIVLNNVLIGEVWLCSGQSNMVMPMKGFLNQPVLNSQEAIASSGNPNIHFFAVNKIPGAQPVSTLQEEWTTCTPASVANFSAVAYFFGKALQKELNVPVGLILSSWGGTRIEPWMSEMALKPFNVSSEEIQKSPVSHNTPGSLFNGMINPLVGYTIKGALWYQGESNRKNPEQYAQLLTAMVNDWRMRWDIGIFPFYYVQIAPYKYDDSANSAYLREAQLKAAKLIPNAQMVSIMDIGENEFIHPPDKKTVAQRLLYTALDKTYGFKGVQSGSPVLKSFTVEDSVVHLAFDNAPLGLTSYGKEVQNFEIAGADKHFYPAQAKVTQDGLDVYSKSIVKPVAVRYAFKNFVVGNLFGVNGFPLSSFRTDEW